MASRKASVEGASLNTKIAMQLGCKQGLQDNQLQDQSFHAASRTSGGAGSRMLAACSRLLGRSKESPTMGSKKKPTKAEQLIDEDDLIDKKLRARSASSLANCRLQQQFLQQHFGERALAGQHQVVEQGHGPVHTQLTTRHSESLSARLSSNNCSPASHQGSVGRGGVTSHHQSFTSQQDINKARKSNSRRQSMLSVSSNSTLDVEPSSQSFSTLLAHLTRAGSPLPQTSPPAVPHHRHVSSPATSQYATTRSSSGMQPIMDQRPQSQDNDEDCNHTNRKCGSIQLKPAVTDNYGVCLSYPTTTTTQQGFSFPAAATNASSGDYGSPTTTNTVTGASNHGYDRQISLSFSPLSATQDSDSGNDKTLGDVDTTSHDITLSPPHVSMRASLVMSPASIPRAKDTFEEDDLMVTRSNSSYSSLVAFLASPGSRPDFP